MGIQEAHSVFPAPTHRMRKHAVDYIIELPIREHISRFLVQHFKDLDNLQLIYCCFVGPHTEGHRDTFKIPLIILVVDHQKLSNGFKYLFTIKNRCKQSFPQYQDVSWLVNERGHMTVIEKVALNDVGINNSKAPVVNLHL